MTAASNTAFGTGVVSVAASATANFITASPSVGGLSGYGSVVLGNAPSTATNLTVNSAVDSTFSGVISDAVAGLGSLTKAGPGTFTVTNASTYGGATNITQGTLRLTGGLPPVTAGLVGYWPLNEGTGTTAYDRSGVAAPANGTLSAAASWVPVVPNASGPNPPFLTCVQINGATATAQGIQGVTMGAISAFGTSTSTQFGLARTISGWVELVPNTNNPGDWHDLFGFTGQEGNGGTFFDMESGNGGNFVTHTYGGDTTISPIVTGQWVYLTATFDPNSDNGNVNVYYDGALTASVQQHGGILNTFDNFGIEVGLNRLGWTEDVSDVTVYNQSLTSSQVAQLYNWTGGGSGGNLLPSTTPLAIAHGANLDLAGASQQVLSLSGSGNVINSNAGSPSVLTLTPSTGVSTTFSGTIGDNGSGNSPGSIALVLDGPGTMVLSGTNTYAGGTTVTAGTLILTNNEALADNSNLSVGNDLSAFPGAVAAAVPASSAPGAGAALSAVPEPGTLALLTAGLVVGFVAWRRKKGI